MTNLLQIITGILVARTNVSCWNHVLFTTSTCYLHNAITEIYIFYFLYLFTYAFLQLGEYKNAFK